jgi:mono/diheme cytochrome c family protein
MIKKLQYVAIAVIFATILYQIREAPAYAAFAQSGAGSNQPENPALGTGVTHKSQSRAGTTPPGAFSSRQDSSPAHASAQAELGASLFRQNCAFCHGQDAGGGESGPDLTQSRLVSHDVAGSKISEVLRDGRPEKGMPSFNFSESEVANIAAFLHREHAAARMKNGNRRGVAVADLQTGSVTAGKQYFNGAGGCASCHSPTGDLAGIASRYQGLQLEKQMLYPQDAKSDVAVISSSGQKTTGTLAYLDEFTVGLWDANGTYHSWLNSNVHYSVSSPADAHIALLSKYSDADIHNLMAYLQALR